MCKYVVILYRLNAIYTYVVKRGRFELQDDL
jgi:hypothetical protein